MATYTDAPIGLVREVVENMLKGKEDVRLNEMD